MKKKKLNGIKADVIGSFRKRTFIEVYCKKCEERYNNDGEYEQVFADKSEAVEVLFMDGWVVRGKNAFCENCQ